jgi:hypothetical protein
MNKIEEIKKLASLKNEGAITLEEFNILKAKILSIDNDNILNLKESANSTTNSVTKINRVDNFNSTINKYPAENNSSNANKYSSVSNSNPNNNAGIYFSNVIAITPLFSIYSINSSTTNSGLGSNARNEAIEKPCHYCNGTGTQVCPSFGGSGVNNMGNECLCVRTYNQAIELGQSPPRFVKSWTFTHCKGTGLASN